MTTYGLQQYFPFDVQPSDGGKVTLTIQIDAIHVKAFMTMLESLSDFFRIINSKARLSLSYVHAPELKAAGLKYYEEYKSAVIDTFKILRKESSESTRELISITTKNIKLIYPNASYDSVKQILTKSGELKKHGYYQKKA